MKKLVIAAVFGAALGGLSVPYIAGPALAQDTESQQDIYRQLDLFGDVFDRIRGQYVEEVSGKELIEAAIDGMLTSLDPHSSYLSPEDATAMRVQTRGAFGGLGIEVTQEEGFVKVVTPMIGTPAEAAGVLSGDFITHVDGQGLLGLTLEDAVGLMRGPVGSEIVVTIAREGEPEPFDVTIIRATIELTAVNDTSVNNTIVVQVTTFNDQTYDNMKEIIETKSAEAGGIENIDGIVVDLRNNPGGLLNQAVLVADAFLETGEITSTRGRDPEDGNRFNARPGDLAQGRPVVVLINGGSASASEIVAGALQNHKRAVVVGTKSFGKGSVQSIMSLPGGGAMRLTTARYYTPSGRSIQALGVSPDIIVEQPRPKIGETPEEDERQPRTEADLRGSLDNDSLTEDERNQIELERTAAEDAAKLREEDYQLAYAIDLLKGLAAIQGN